MFSLYHRTAVNIILILADASLSAMIETMKDYRVTVNTSGGSSSVWKELACSNFFYFKCTGASCTDIKISNFLHNFIVQIIKLSWTAVLLNACFFINTWMLTLIIDFLTYYPFTPTVCLNQLRVLANIANLWRANLMHVLNIFLISTFAEDEYHRRSIK